MDFTVVALAVVVIILVYVLYQYFTTNITTLAKKVNLKSSNASISIDKNATSHRYTYSMWLYVNTWSAEYKPVFWRNYNAGFSPATPVVAGASDNANVMMLYLDANSPTLYFKLPESTAADVYQPYILTPNFPLQTWTYIAISVDSQYIDFYINGKLVKSVKMQNLPTTPSDGTTSPVNLGSGWDGQITTFTFQDTPLSPQAAWTAYQSGSGSTSKADSYNVNVDLLKNNVNQKTFTLF